MSLRAYIEKHALQFIAVFKFFKGLLLLATGIGARHLAHRDIALEVERWADAFRIDPSNRYIHLLLMHLSNLDEKKLRELSIGTFLYAAIFLTEGAGLWFEKRWAEYFTILVTSSFIPLEVYEIYRRFTAPRLTLLLLNLAIVAYLVFDLRSRRERGDLLRQVTPSVQSSAGSVSKVL